MYEIENLKNIPDNARVTSELAEKTVEKIINALTVKKGISETVAVALIAGLVQNGGTNKGAGNSAKFTLVDQTLSAQELVNYIKKEQLTKIQEKIEEFQKMTMGFQNKL